jgi:hypothetical protein
MNTRTLLGPIALGAPLALIVPTADAQVGPDVFFGIEDDDQNGTPDGFSSSGLASAITDRFAERRTFAEWSLAIADGPIVQSATISGTLTEGFSFGFGTAPADLSLELYSANGAPDLSDWDIAGVQIGTIENIQEDFDTLDFSFDITADLQALLDASEPFVGVRIRTLTPGIGQVDVEQEDLFLTASFIPAPGAAALLAAPLVVRRRRR